MEIERMDAGSTDGFSVWYTGALETLAHGLVEESALIFLGAGCNVDDAGSLPTAGELSSDMAKACNLEWHEYIPLSTIAFYYESFFSREKLNAYLERKFAAPTVQPSATLCTLVEIIRKLESRGISSLVITTNYDRQLETAYRNATGRDLEVVIYNGGTDANQKVASLHPHVRRAQLWRPSKLTTLYKMHGCISMPQTHEGSWHELHNLVVTEEDYINFLSNALSHDESKFLLPHILARIAESTTLFIGYGLADWNFRVVFKATAELNDKAGYAVQGPKPERVTARHQAAVAFWGHKNVQIVNEHAAIFVADLSAAVDRELASRPQSERRQSAA